MSDCSDAIPPTRVFLRKSSEMLEGVGVDVREGCKRVCKCMKTLGRVFEELQKSAQEHENREVEISASAKERGKECVRD